MNSRQNILITGAASCLAKALVPKLAKDFTLIGVDLSQPEFVFPGKLYLLDYTKRALADIFRSHNIWAIVHLGRIKPTRRVRHSFRFNQNVLGTKSILRNGWQFGVKNFVIISTHQVYGAFKENYLYLNEDESLKAHALVAELSDAVELDHEATEFMWRHPSAKTVILRPAHIVGADIEGPLMTSLRGPLSPCLLGFDPLMQFIHQDDMVEALLCTLKKPTRGVFNIAGEGVIPYSDALLLAGSKPFPIPSQAFPILFKLIGYHMPKHFIEYLKYPIIVADDAFRKAFTFFPKMTIKETLQNIF